MDLKEFKAGYFISQSSGYKSFEAELINHSYVWSDPQINTLLEEASLKLGALSTIADRVPDIDRFIRMHITKEATSSTRIEGTQTSMKEALMDNIQIWPERQNDWKEVRNYIKAINYSIKQLEIFPLSSRLLMDTHNILLEEVETNKYPGEFRRSQNWIGGANLQDAVFIPPHWRSVPSLISDLEMFIHDRTVQVPHLIKIAIAHYQLETIHPFCDGNGRIGRLLITLYLVDSGILKKPVLHLSAFFEKHKSLYYENLMNVRLKNNLTQWIKFFLVAVIETCDSGIACFQEVLELRERLEEKTIIDFGKRISSAKELLYYLYSNPVVTVKEVSRHTDLSTAATNSLISTFVEAGILEEVTGFKRNRLFVFSEYLQIFEGSI